MSSPGRSRRRSRSSRRGRRAGASESGQAILLVVGGLAFLLLGAAILAAIASGLTGRGEQQRAADLAALAAARTMAVDHPHVFEPEVVDGVPNAAHVDRAEYLARARATAEDVARANGVDAVSVAFPDLAEPAPMRVRVRVLDALEVGGVAAGTSAEAELVVGADAVATGPKGVGEYAGPCAMRQGNPLRTF